jgi:hypothetical protein
MAAEKEMKYFQGVNALALFIGLISIALGLLIVAATGGIGIGASLVLVIVGAWMVAGLYAIAMYQGWERVGSSVSPGCFTCVKKCLDSIGESGFDEWMWIILGQVLGLLAGFLSWGLSALLGAIIDLWSYNTPTNPWGDILVFRRNPLLSRIL